ncbi:MAG: HEAT repeat domain-containing protein, partial [Cyanobacteriota bacterium]
MTIRNLPAGIDSQRYLESLQQNDRFKDCRELYTSTQAQILLQVQARKEQKGQRPGEPKSEQPEPPREPPVEVLKGLRDAVKEHRQVLLIGKPGSGKTTALRRLVWEGVSAWASGRVDEAALPVPVPVVVELRELREGTVEELVRRTLRRYRQPLSPTEIEDLLFEGRLCLLFDGVNELPSANAWAEVSRFRGDYPDTPMIFSTRSLGAGVDLGIAHKLEMVPLTEPQMREFVRKRLPDRAKTLLQQLGGRLRELAETPLLLAMLCEVFEQDGQIPRSRGELFRTKFSQQYAAFKPLREQPVSEDFRRLAPELLKHLAFAMMQGDSPTEFRLQIPQDEAETLLQTYLSAHQETNPASRAREYLEDLLEHHLLQLAANPDEVEFHHQLFQEYYAAEALLPKLNDLTDDQLKCHYLNYLKWTEPLAIALSLIDKTRQASQIMQQVLDTDLMLGARLAYSLDKEHSLICRGLLETFRISKILEQIDQLTFLFENPKFLHQETANWNDEEGTEEGGLFFNYETDFPGLLKGLCYRDEAVRSNAAIRLSRLAKKRIPEAITALSAALEDPVYEVRNIAVKTLGKLKCVGMTELLRKSKHPEYHVRWAVVDIIAISELKTEDSVALLVDLCSDSEYLVSSQAAYALSEIKAVEALKHLWGLYLASERSYFLGAIAAIQSRCGFYNYDLYQARLK